MVKVDGSDPLAPKGSIIEVSRCDTLARIFSNHVYMHILFYLNITSYDL